MFIWRHRISLEYPMKLVQQRLSLVLLQHLHKAFINCLHTQVWYIVEACLVVFVVCCKGYLIEKESLDAVCPPMLLARILTARMQLRQSFTPTFCGILLQCTSQCWNRQAIPIRIRPPRKITWFADAEIIREDLKPLVAKLRL